MKTASLADVSRMVILLAASAAFAGEDVPVRPRPERAAALFTEDFNGIRGGGNGHQCGTYLSLKHSVNLPGWTKTGLGAVHAVEHAGGDWALQLVGAEGKDNVLTLNAGFAANVKGKTYAVSLDVGPSVWAGRRQATRADGH